MVALRLPRSLPRSVLLGILLGGCAWFGISSTPEAEPAKAGPAKAEPAKYALLVGCTKYVNLKDVNPLTGPGNDIPLWDKLLTSDKTFAFPGENVTQLVGWPDDESKRPTYANIVKGFENLIARAKADDQVVIVMSGHGTQQPIPESQKDPLDPENPEPDGMDEVFLPADVSEFAGGTLHNAIIDNQVGKWLDRLRDKGAHVLIVFDCCHSGSMTRDPRPVEVNRSVAPTDLGIPPEAIKKAAQRAQEAVAAAEKAGRHPLEEAQKVKPEKNAKGSLVAFFGCQRFEESPELPRPEDAAPVPENYYGMLSYTLTSALAQRQGPLTYRELTHILAAKYRAERGARPPTPYSEGDLDREVLGLKVWPQRSALIIDSPRRDVWQVNAGSLQGLTPGSVLTVHPPAGDKRDEKTVLGYVKVTAVELSTATVEPHSPDNKTPAIEAKDLPRLGRCAVYSEDLGDLRVKLGYTKPTATVATAALERLHAGVKPMVVAVADEGQAEWVLRQVTPAEATRDFGLTIPADRVLLLQGEGHRTDAKDSREAAERLRAEGHPLPRKVYGEYPTDPDQLAGELDRDLPKMFRWQNIWRIAGASGGARSENDQGLVFEVAKLKDEKDTTGGRPLTENVLKPGDVLEYRLKNTGDDDLWVTMLKLDPNLEIQVRLSGDLHRGQEWKPLRTQIDVSDGSYGTEGVVVFAVPTTVVKEKPDYDFLVQEPLHVGGRAPPRPVAPPKSRFGQVMHAAAFGTPQMRGEHILSEPAADPAVLWRSWVTVVPPKAP